MAQFVSIGKIVLILAVGSIAFVLVSVRLPRLTALTAPFIIPTAAAALTGAAVGVGGLRLCTLAGVASPWLALPAFVVVVCVGLVAGSCVANALAPAITAAGEDWDVGLGLFSGVWAIYGAAGTLLGFVMMLCIYIIRARGVP